MELVISISDFTNEIFFSTRSYNKSLYKACKFSTEERRTVFNIILSDTTQNRKTVVTIQKTLKPLQTNEHHIE